MCPLYDYKCQCGKSFDDFKPMKDRDSSECPSCGKLAKKIPNVVNFTFGWELSENSHLKGQPDELVRRI